MISWGRIFYGAALSAIITVVVLAVRREREPRVLATLVAASFLAPLAWNAILYRVATEEDGFFVDIPFKPFPVSWQDTGSGVFTLALASVALGIVLRRERASRVIGLALVTAIVAFVVDIYLY